MNELHLFAGAGGGILGGMLLGHTTVCAVEIEPYPRKVLLQRQRDGILPKFPIWDDVTTFDGNPWRGKVDVVCGGFPCQDISSAGKGAGISGERSGLWREMARIIGEVQPGFVLVENSPMLVGRGLGLVLSDLAALGYDCRWGIVGAHNATAPHKRNRIWIMANSKSINRRLPVCTRNEKQSTESFGSHESMGYTHGICGRAGAGREDGAKARDSSWWLAEPAVGRVAHGVAAWVDRLRAIGNGQVPAVARLAWEILMEKA